MFFGRLRGSSARTFALAASVTVAATASLSACGVSDEQGSSVAVVNLPHTESKWQSIGNCWSYAFAGWAESLVLAASNGATTLNISESYITYRDYQSKLLSASTRGAKEIETGGWWETAAQLTLRHGYLLEGEFAPEENDKTFSQRQKDATAYISASMAEGLLKTDRSPATVKAELNKAFGVDIDALALRAKDSGRVILKAATATTRAETLATAMQTWRPVRWARNWSSAPAEDQLPAWAGRQNPAQAALLKRVKKALNAGHPVIIDWFVDFNALTDKGEFSGKQLELKGAGRQGYHSTVIEDYVVEGVNPATGTRFVIGEGEATPEQKRLAEEFGEISYFVVKNSWGGLERVDRASYVREGVGGYHKLDADYIFAWLKQVDDKGEFEGTDTGATRFILPPGF